MKIFYDTEFIERGYKYPIDLISIGMVTEYGETFYAENCDTPIESICDHPWLADNVLPHLQIVGINDTKNRIYPTWDHNNDKVMSRVEIRDNVQRFIEDQILPRQDIELWAWYGAYDHVVFAQLWNTMNELPHTIPMYTNDLKQELTRIEKTSRTFRYNLPEANPSDAHNALYDALLLKKRYDWLMSVVHGI